MIFLKVRYNDQNGNGFRSRNLIHSASRPSWIRWAIFFIPPSLMNLLFWWFWTRIKISAPPSLMNLLFWWFWTRIKISAPMNDSSINCSRIVWSFKSNVVSFFFLGFTRENFCIKDRSHQHMPNLMQNENSRICPRNFTTHRMFQMYYFWLIGVTTFD